MNCKCCNGYIPDEIKTGAIKYHAWNGVEQKNDPVKCELCGMSDFYKIIHEDDLPYTPRHPEDRDIEIQRPKPRWDDPIWYWQCRYCLNRFLSHIHMWESCEAENGRMCEVCSDNVNHSYPKMIALDAVAPEVFNTDTGMFELGERIQ